jgi:ABC-type transporter Mla subunit MlaD
MSSAAKTRLALILLLAATGAAILLFRGSGEQREVRLTLDRAYGLADGSPVLIGGKRQGTVALSIGRGDKVIAKLRLDADAPVVDRDARVAIVAANLLGQKRVEVYPSKAPSRTAAPRGFTVPTLHVTVPTDLDEVLAVLDADTRTRAMILLNELGTAVLGRSTDISQLLTELPGGLEQATRVVDQLEADNQHLRRLIPRANRFVAVASAHRRELAGLIETAARASAPLAERRRDLDASLRQAPATLTAARGFLRTLDRTAAPLGSAARGLTRTAEPLQSTLAAVGPLATAAAPTLVAAARLAPKLSTLGRRATPDLRKALPVLDTLRTLSTSLAPVSQTLDRSSDNILAILENWARAIQFRDGLGHVFRGEASFSADAVRSAVERLLPPQRRRGAPKRTGAPSARRPASTPPASNPPAEPTASQPAGVPPVVGTVTQKIDDLVNGLLGGIGAKPKDDQPPAKTSVGALLDYLLNP